MGTNAQIRSTSFQSAFFVYRLMSSRSMTAIRNGIDHHQDQMIGTPSAAASVQVMIATIRISADPMQANTPRHARFV